MRVMWDFGANTKWEKHKPKRSGVEGTAQSQSLGQQQAGEKNIGTAQGTLSQFEGPITSSPYYKSLVATGTDATSDAFTNAKANTAARARQAGFGYSSPIGQAASRETEGQEASALAQVPTKAIEATAPLELEAAKETGALGLGETQAGNQLFSGGVVPLEEEYMKRKNQFTNRLWDMGLSGVEAATKV